MATPPLTGEKLPMFFRKRGRRKRREEIGLEAGKKTGAAPPPPSFPPPRAPSAARGTSRSFSQLFSSLDPAPHPGQDPRVEFLIPRDPNLTGERQEGASGDRAGSFSHLQQVLEGNPRMSLGTSTGSRSSWEGPGTEGQQEWHCHLGFQPSLSPKIFAFIPQIPILPLLTLMSGVHSHPKF